MAINVFIDLLLSILHGPLSRETKVTQLCPTIVVDQDVRGLDVSVEDIRRVQVVQRAYYIVHYYFYVLLAEVKLLIIL